MTESSELRVAFLALLDTYHTDNLTPGWLFAETSKLFRVPSSCPHVRTSGEGTSYCELAAASVEPHKEAWEWERIGVLAIRAACAALTDAETDTLAVGSVLHQDQLERMLVAILTTRVRDFPPVREAIIDGVRPQGEPPRDVVDAGKAIYNFVTETLEGSAKRKQTALSALDVIMRWTGWGARPAPVVPSDTLADLLAESAERIGIDVTYMDAGRMAEWLEARGVRTSTEGTP